MSYQRVRVLLAAAFAIIPMSACSEQNEPAIDYLDSGQVKVDEHDIDMVDHYIEIDQRALVGVDKALADKALAGDGSTAVKIGRAFARANHIAESRFWYRIAAENGDGIGMNDYAIAVSEFDCRRSIYWFRKAAASSDFSAETKAAIAEEIEEMVPTCR